MKKAFYLKAIPITIEKTCTRGSIVNKRKITMLLIITTIFMVTAFYSSRNLIINAAVNDVVTNDNLYYASSDEIYATKLMSHSGPPAYDNNSYIGETFSITIEIANIGTVDLTDVNVTSPESDLEKIGYEDEWFTFIGDPNRYVGTMVITNITTIVYSVTPHRAGDYTFPGSNITYSNGTHSLYYITNKLEFKVFKEPPSLKLEKLLFINGEETTDGRVKRENEFFIRIRATNYFYDTVNLSISDAPPGNPANFTYNETLLDSLIGEIESGQSKTYEYNLSAITNGTYLIPKCNGTYNFVGEIDITIISSNTVELFVYDPIYDGNDWTKRVPLLSITKYFQIRDEEGNLLNRTEVKYNNATLETVTIIINITNAGIVEALNILAKETTYNDWVFVTNGVPELWGPFNLSRYESKILNYTIDPLILGAFKIEPTEVTYEFINQENLLLETDNKLYSNVIEIIIEAFVPTTVYTEQWIITIGISLGIVAFVAIPLVITTIMFRNRRRIQKGT